MATDADRTPPHAASTQAELIAALLEHRRQVAAHWGTGSASVAKVDEMITTARQVYGQLVFGAERYEKLSRKMAKGHLGA